VSGHCGQPADAAVTSGPWRIAMADSEKAEEPWRPKVVRQISEMDDVRGLVDALGDRDNKSIPGANDATTVRAHAVATAEVR